MPKTSPHFAEAIQRYGDVPMRLDQEASLQSGWLSFKGQDGNTPLTGTSYIPATEIAPLTPVPLAKLPLTKLVVAGGIYSRHS